MKINFIVPSTSTVMGSGIRVIFRHANYLADKGHDVVVYVPMLFYIGKKFILRTSISNSFLRRAKLGWMDYRFKTKLAFKISDAFIRDADITIATAWYTAPFVNKLSSKKGRKVYFIQDYEIWNQDENEVNATYQMPMHRIVITNKLKKLLEEKLGVASTVVYNGHSSDEYMLAPKVINHPRKLMMLWNSASYKGGQAAMDMLSELQVKYNFRLTLFSVEPQKQFPSWVEFYHQPERKLLISLYQQADIYIFPSLAEAWGLPVMEAMANKCAVVGMNTGLLADVCSDNNQALICNCGDYDSFKNKIVSLLEDDELLKRLQRAGNNFSKNYSWDRQCALFEKELLSIV